MTVARFALVVFVVLAGAVGVVTAALVSEVNSVRDEARDEAVVSKGERDELREAVALLDAQLVELGEEPVVTVPSNGEPVIVEGPPGATGAQGDPGVPGLRGQPGADGSDGEDGATGERGPQGLTGARGATGETGPVGPPGDTGSQGAPGEQGSVGATGATGATGPVGPQGPEGPPPDAATVAQIVARVLASLSFTCTPSGDVFVCQVA